MKKRTVWMVCGMMLWSVMGGCSGGENVAKLGQAENEIMTYEPIDPAKTTLVVSTVGSTDAVENMSDAFEEKNPDVQVVVLDVTGGNKYVRPVVDWVVHGKKPDIMFLNTSTFEDEQVVETHFENLSANPVISNFDAEALHDAAVNSNIYMLPGPTSVYCMHYNKTLFDQYGWEKPVTFDDFVALCLQITKDTEGTVQPWNPGAKYSDTLSTAIESMVYEDIFGGYENRSWYKGFQQGTETFEGHMEPYYEVLQTLIDNGLLREEHFTYSATTRGKEFAEGKIAMYNHDISTFADSPYEIGYMPFPTTTGNQGYVNSTHANMLGVPKKYHTDKEKDAINRYLQYYASPDGQTHYIGNRIMFSSVKNVELNTQKDLKELRDAIQNGRSFTLMTFQRENKPSATLHEDALAMVRGEKTMEQCIEAVDKGVFTGNITSPTQQVVGSAGEDFTILETSMLIADLYREKTGAQIGLITHNGVYRGNMMGIFQGELTGNHVITLLPRSFENQSKLVKVSMTGKQLLDALNRPMGNEQVADVVYAYSGLKGTVAPWKPLGQRYVSLTMEDGTAIDPNSLYTVAVWEGTVYGEYITEVLESYEGTFVELFTEKLQREKTIYPPKDGRMRLVWDT